MDTSLQPIIDRIRSRQNNESSLLGTLITGVFAGVMMVIMTVTFASLIFSGNLTVYLSAGISIGLTSVIVIGTLVTLFSSSSHLIVQIDDDTAPIFALLLTLLAATLPATLSSVELFSNLLVALFLATIIAGITLTVFGVFQLGNFVQFLPYSVMGGYFAAVGWLLLLGAMTMLTRIEISSLGDIKLLFGANNIEQWLPAVIIGLWLRLMSSRLSKGILLGGTVLITIMAFYGIHYLMGHSPQQLMAANYLIGPFAQQEHSLLKPIIFLDWSSIEWQSTLKTVGSIASITLICLLSMVLCISGLSLTTRKDLDINHELKIVGLANIASGLLGGMSALPSLSISKLTYDIYPTANRLIGVIAILVGVVTFYFGMSLVAYTPKIVMGSLLIYIGLGFVKEWLIDGYRKFGALEYSVIPIILVVSIFAGFLEGIVIGIIAAIILFVIKYSRIKIIRFQASGADFRSNLMRDAQQNKILKEHGEQVRIFTLQGYLFFGTAGTLYKAVLDSIEEPQNKSLKYVLLDFSQVIGVDSSATLNFEKLAQRLAERKIYLITTSLKGSVLEILRRGGIDLGGSGFLIQHHDLDQGLEWCETDILKQQESEAQVQIGIFERIAEALPYSARLDKLAKYLNKVEVTSGQLIANIGEESDDVFFLETCTASAYIIDSNNLERRVSGAGRGAIYGEIGFFLGIPRTAIVRADSDGELYSLKRIALAEMEREEPELAAAIISYLARIVTERLASTTRSLQAIL